MRRDAILSGIEALLVRAAIIALGLLIFTQVLLSIPGVARSLVVLHRFEGTAYDSGETQ